MPLVNTWIKNEDWDKYYQLASNKQWGEFIHNALNKDIEVVTKYERGKKPEYSVDGGKTYKPNIKENPDGTVSIADPSKPATLSEPKRIDSVEAVKAIFPDAKVMKPVEKWQGANFKKWYY